ncbi:phosphoribosylanthranilate isomerase [Anatilimnocola sp. NA78]|uniref:phosphoribosylanthranilate isomerase n=1 Tax=Anatilimnocola sp. NA78 TaxID=3415683 RepID=UPI003CE5A11A
MNPSSRVKICCIASIQEAAVAVRHGASALGLVSKMPSGPGPIEESLIAQIAATIPPAIGSFLLTSAQSVPQIIQQQRRCGANTLQIVDRLEVGEYHELRGALPGISLVQVIHVTGEESFDEACQIAERGVNALLLDSGNPSLAIKELGGTGRVHDWSISRRIVTAVKVPVFLAGGLNAGNVAEAIRSVRPFGIDVCSGVRTKGELDEQKLSAFMTAIASCR